MLDTGALTDIILEALADGTDQLVGDAVAPHDGGWLEGQPNTNLYRPYTVVVFQGAVPRDPTMRYSESIRAFVTTWRMEHFGASRRQADWMAAQMRHTVADLLGMQAEGFRITGAAWRSLGPMTRSDVIDPPHWSIMDTFTLHCDA